jgi:hypothetical protein
MKAWNFFRPFCHFMKIIFLDIDGVLNCEDAYRGGECKYIEWINQYGDPDHHQSFCSWNKEWLNKLIEESGAKIVVSSTWRRSGIEWLKRVWEIEGMSGEIIGVTSVLRNSSLDYTIPRGCEIDKWLADAGFYHINWDREQQDTVIEKSGIENYIIIDDDSDMLYKHRNHFVHVLPSPRNKKGFTRDHYVEAMQKLSWTVTEQTYGV